MIDQFTIRADWAGKGEEASAGAPRDLLAHLRIAVGQRIATKCQYSPDGTTQDFVPLSVFDLAQWFASNWWRLRWEAKKTGKRRRSWAMSHEMGSVGGGYSWPRIAFACDGESMTVEATSDLKVDPRKLENRLYRYLEDFTEVVTTEAFEREVDGFMEGVISRLRESDGEGADLKKLWTLVLSDRADPEMAEVRRLEARLGFDQGEAPESLMEELFDIEERYGYGAVSEIAEASGADAMRDIRILLDQLRPKATKVSIPELAEVGKKLEEWPLSPGDAVPPTYSTVATRAAAETRRQWALGHGPVDTKELLDRLGIRERDWKPSRIHGAAMTAGFRDGEEGVEGTSVFLHSPYSDNRRFALARLVGDCIRVPSPSERILPQTRETTTRQKFQRVFAQEFLCPFSELVEFLDVERFDQDEARRASRHFGVGAPVVQWALVNNGVLDEERAFC